MNDQTTPELLLSRYLEVLPRFIPDAVDLRHRVHSNPRVGGEEEPTAQLIAELLGAGDAPSIADGRIIRFGSEAGPAVGLRTELDALPIVENTGIPWASQNGAMHACGHDVHMAGLVAAVRTLLEVGIPVPLVAVLQPREETYPCGAPDMLASPQWQESGIAAVVGAHLQPRLPQGAISAPPGVVNAASDEFRITVRGRGGHAAYPHTLIDPVVVTAQIVTALQQLISRRKDPMLPATLSVGSIHGGSAANVVPDAVELRGTIRTFGPAHREALAEQMRKLVSGVAEGHGCHAEVVITLGEPVLENDTGLATRLSGLVRRLGFDDSATLRSCGADDFAYYCEAVPSMMIFVGTGGVVPGEPGLHDARFLPPDEAVEDIAKVLLAGYVAAAESLRARSLDLAESGRARP